MNSNVHQSRDFKDETVPGYVYVIKLFGGAIKVGITKSHDYSKLHSYPREMEILRIYASGDCERLERKILRSLNLSPHVSPLYIPPIHEDDVNYSCWFSMNSSLSTILRFLDKIGHTHVTYKRRRCRTCHRRKLIFRNFNVNGKGNLRANCNYCRGRK